MYQVIDVDPSAARDGDFVAVVTDLVNRAYTSAESALWTKDLPRTNPAEMQSWIAGSEVVLALKGSDPVAAVRTRIGDSPAGWFGALAVDPSVAGRGIATLLVDHVEQRALHLGCTTMHIEMLSAKDGHDDHLERLRVWYSARGYRETGRQPLELFAPDDAVFAALTMDVVDMAKPLSRQPTSRPTTST